MLALRHPDQELVKFAAVVEQTPTYKDRQKFLMQVLCQRWVAFDFESSTPIQIDESSFQAWLKKNQYSEDEYRLAAYYFEEWKSSPDNRQAVLNQVVLGLHQKFDKKQALEVLAQWLNDKDFSEEELKAAKTALKACQSPSSVPKSTPTEPANPEQKVQPTPKEPVNSKPSPKSTPTEPANPEPSVQPPQREPVNPKPSAPKSAPAEPTSKVPTDPLTELGLAVAEIFNEFSAKCRFLPPIVESPRCWEVQLEISPGIKVSAFQALGSELQVSPRLKNLQMTAAPTIQACPGVGISVQILKPSFEPILLESYLEWRDSSPTDPLVFDLGIGLRNKPIALNLSEFPHFMISSTTGGGKTNVQHTIVVSGAYRYAPNHLQFVLIDPKGVSFTPYKDLPHLWTGQHLADAKLLKDCRPLNRRALTDPSEIVRFFMTMLKAEVNLRKTTFATFEERSGFRVPDIRFYNRRSPTPMPRLMIMIDETRPLIEMFDQAGVDFDRFITGGAELFRFAGVHFGCGMQYAKGVVLPGARECLTHKLVGFMSTPEASKSVLGNDSATALGAKGEFIYRFGAMDQRLQAFYAGDEERDDCFIYRAVNRAKQHYKGRFL